MVERLFLAVSWGCLRFVIVVFPDHTHLLFLVKYESKCTFTPTEVAAGLAATSFGVNLHLFLPA